MMSNQTVVPAASPPQTASQVSWQTAFWTLIPLATNVMTQPSGRVLSLPTRYRTYLRSSPILCALDVLCFLVRIAITPRLLGISLQEALTVTLRERYLRTEDISEGIQNLEKQTLLRWFFFLVGTVAPGIKLASMQGIPWTKAWGMMFLGSFLVLEIMVIFKKSPRGEGYLGNEPELSQRQTRFLTIFRAREREAFLVGLTFHLSLLIWAIFDAWGLRISAYPLPGHKSLFPVEPLVPFFMATVSLLAVTPAITLTWIIYTTVSRWPSPRFGAPGRNCYRIALDIIGSIIVVVSWILLLAFIVTSLIGVPYTRWMSITKTTILIDIPLLLFLVSIFPATMTGIQLLCRRYQSLASRLLIKPSGDGTHAFVHFEALLNLMFFLTTLSICPTWYALRFDPEGTVNPSWAGIFGS
ncbi:hypothetical protein B0O99DRAFT_743471 [Bisporella sp. PMI_857]|nr:hypothetical protein B0O99DRAFT_743471 [Bisporella sp. PMI_857]